MSVTVVYASETLEVSCNHKGPRGEVGREKRILRSWKVGIQNGIKITFTVGQLLLLYIVKKIHTSNSIMEGHLKF